LLSRRLLKFSAATQQWTSPQVSPTIPVSMTAAYVIADPKTVGTVYVTTGVFLPPAIGVTRDGGTNWTRIATPQMVFFIAPDATLSNRIFIASDTDIFRTDDSGSTWTNVLPGVRAASTIAVSPDVVAFLGREGMKRFVYRSLDGGTTWDKFDSVSAYPFTTTESTTILAGGRSLFALVPGRIIRSDDGGATWRSISETLPFVPTSIAIDGAFLHAGTPRGVWELPLTTRHRAASR
jgi:photosystem II stability/assembly factor-like uncharacterized protein